MNIEKESIIYEIISSELVNKIMVLVLPYYETNDEGHQIDHAIGVTNIALNMLKALHLGMVQEMKIDIFLAAMLHDIRADQRKDHHLLGCLESYNNLEIRKLIEQYATNPMNVWYAIYEHRASYSGTFTSLVSEIVSSADRAEPDVEKWVARVKKGNINENMEEALSHIQKKMGRNGYARLPFVYMDYYGESINTFFDDLEDKEKLIEIWNRV
jgi:HD superfamily phosphohydrolase YqeK